MNNAIEGSTGMTPDTIMTQSNDYGNDTWSISPYSQSPYNNSPMTEYGNWGGFIPQNLQAEPMGSRMPPPQAQPQIHHQMIQPAPTPMAHHQLPMLNTTWPSQLTNPSPTGSYSAPPLSMAPLSNPQPVETPRQQPAPAPPPPQEKARRTLSTEQKRAMCLYYEENPSAKQAEIGARFGVERSTVSKVLRQKEHYLKREQEQEPSSSKRGKGKHPDFDRTLSNYVRRQQEGGFEIKDEEIMDQAKLFARASGHQDSLVSSLTSSWLQKFKQKHGITSGRLMRRASETNIPDSARMSTSRSKKKKEKSDIISPTSPSGQKSPLSDSRSDEDQQHDGFDFSAFSYRQAASQSATSLSSNLRDAGNNSSFSSSAMSPTGTLTFSPDPNTGAFAVDQTLQSQMADIRTSSITPSSDLQPREKRSNTFPSLNLDLVNQVVSSEPMTPRHQIPSTAPSSAIESPVHDFNSAPFGIDSTLTSPPQLHRSSSNSSMTGRSTPITNGTMPAASIDSSPVSPSQEDACRAATTLLSYIQSSMKTNGQFEHSELMTLVQLTNKLQVHQYQSLRPAMGGLSRIPEGDGEVPATNNEVMMETM
ncbi:unnamed protein product [Clonostachys rosea f. rosea IK726]|uniref:HTH CENPB-type domain-containing protein n=2 Tax=Bionectria ochroleuca TaxID=29856 RepID=A0A0B7JS63_BIOOC|nr:unnamed protein product [Clonostachys rosea f. rosea IK726]